MDPDKCLEEIVAMLDRDEPIEDPYEDFLELAGKVQDLHEWLSKGGFLPKAWASSRGAP